MTIIEIMVVVLLLAFMLLLLIPILENLHAQSLKTECGNNLRQLGAAFELYQARHDDWLPANQVDGSWRTYMDPYLNFDIEVKNWKGSSPHWQCPLEGEYFANSLCIGDNRYDPRQYITHWKTSQFSRPTRVPVVSDSLPGEYSKAAIGDYRGVDFRHDGHAVILFMDGRVEAIKGPSPETGNWWNEPKKGQPVQPPASRPSEPDSASDGGHRPSSEFEAETPALGGGGSK